MVWFCKTCLDCAKYTKRKEKMAALIVISLVKVFLPGLLTTKGAYAIISLTLNEQTNSNNLSAY